MHDEAINVFKFEDVLKHLKQGRKARMVSWQGIYLQADLTSIKTPTLIIYLYFGDGCRTLWYPSSETSKDNVWNIFE